LGDRFAWTPTADSFELVTGYEGERLRLFWAVGVAIERIAAGRPLLLLLDDLQWADDSTIQLLHFLVRRFENPACDQRILIIAAFRPEEVRKGSALARLSAEHKLGPSDTNRIHLAPLDDAGSEAVIADRLGGRIEPDSRARIVEMSRGNPLFVEQMAALLIEESRISWSDAGWMLAPGAPLAAPRAAREVIMRRLQSVDVDVRDVLTLASIFGDRFNHGALRRAWEGTERALLAALEWACEAGLIHETAGTYRFQHPLLREVLLESTSPARRSSLHRRAGLALEASYDRDAMMHAAELAVHFAEAGEEYGPKAAAYLEPAGDDLCEAYAWAEALTFYAQAVELMDWDDRAGTARVQEKAGDAAMSTSQHETARKHFQAALSFVDSAGGRSRLQRKIGITHERLGEFEDALSRFTAAEGELANLNEPTPTADAGIRLSRAEILIRLSHGQEAQTVAEEAAGLLGEAPSAELALAHHVLGAAALQQGDLHRASECHERSRQICESIGDHHGVAESLTQLSRLMTLRGNLREAEQGYQAASAIFEKIGDPEGMAESWDVLGTTAAYRGSYAEAESYLQTCLRLREQIGDPGRIADCWNALGLVAARRGDLEEAERRLDLGLHMQSHHSGRNLAGAWGSLGLVAFGKGEYDEAQRWYKKSLEIQLSIADQYGYALSLVGLGLVRQYRGDLSGAEALYRESITLQERMGGLPWTGYALYGLGDVACERGDLVAALSFTRRARRLAHRLELFDLEALAALAQARVFLKAGRTRAPEALIERAAALANDNNATKTSAEAALAMAEFSLLRQDLWGARAQAQAALDIATHSKLLREQGLAHRMFGRAALAAGGEQNEAMSQLEGAEAIFIRIGARLELARTWMELAVLFERQSDTTGAADRRRRAAEVFESAGVSGYASEAGGVEPHPVPRPRKRGAATAR
jgi:tetratricopeptide (TPR) repeat protein